MGFAPTWLRQLSPLVHKTTLTTAVFFCRAVMSLRVLRCFVIAVIFGLGPYSRSPKYFRTELRFRVHISSVFLTPLHGRQKGHPAVRPLKILHPTIHNGSFWKT